MSWLHHPKFKGLRAKLVEQLRAKEFRFRKVNSVVFLCGGADSIRRDRLADYLHKNYPDLLLFYADDVWPAIAAMPDRNALQMEAQLAALADMVIIIVESPGTFTELGAFSLSDPLRKKLLPLVDRANISEPSFINTGPLRWIEQDSDFSPIIWTHLDTLLLSTPELDERLERLPPEQKTRISNLPQSPKHLLFFICDIISIFGPCDVPIVDTLVHDILETTPAVDVASLVGLAQAMSLVCEYEYNHQKYYFSPLNSSGRLHSYHRKKFLDIPGMRASVLSVLQSIDEARLILGDMGEI